MSRARPTRSREEDGRSAQLGATVSAQDFMYGPVLQGVTEWIGAESKLLTCHEACSLASI